MLGEAVEAPAEDDRPAGARSAVIEDYKPLDVECAAVNLALLRRHPRALPGVAPASSTATAATRT